MASLEELAYTRRGFCTSELRRAVWLLLLGLSPAQAVDPSWRRLLAGLKEDTKEARVMQADVQRSVYSWDVHTGLRKTTRDQKRVQLSEVMHAILRRHAGKLGYFQGFHDIVLVFLEVGTPAQAFHMVERLALFHLSDQLCLPFDQGLLPLLAVLFQLLGLLDEALAAALLEADCAEMHFAVPWVLTWFAHSLPRLHQQVMRLFDCLLCSHPAAILYFVAALLIQHRDVLLQTPREMPEMVCAIQSLPLAALDVDAWAVRARALMRQVPPSELLAKLDPHRRRSLPQTTPLFHWPHPWMKDPAPAAGAVEMSKLAPIYAPAGSARPPVKASGSAAGGALQGLPARLLEGRGGMRLLLRALGIGGDKQAGAAHTVLAFFIRALGLAAALVWARTWVKR